MNRDKRCLQKSRFIMSKGASQKNGWREAKLGDIGKFRGGVTSIKKEDYGFGTPFITYMNIYKNSKIKDERWQETGLLDIIEIIGGGTPKTTVAEYWDGDIPWLSGGDIASNHKTLPMAFSQSNYGVLPRYKECFFFSYLLLDHLVEKLNAASHGSVFDTITTATFKGIHFALPQENFIENFENSVRPNFKKILENSHQVRTLGTLRDALLPKVMNGKIRAI